MKAATKRSLFAVLLALAVAACIALVGCGDNTAKYKEKFIGTWNLTEMTSPDTGTITADDLALFGMTVTMTITDDGKAKLSMLDESMEMEWKVDNEKQITLKDNEGATGSFKLGDDGLLVGEEDGTSMTFKKAS
ncbi:hypothetical protein [Curtanaerobium respiraculi]|uniref:hypothetical protein n=1 Tax=Curtanaerobium respiraculi TaxID=2949669 RepID=UPI0024B3B899|nr:hypothetical protein [Curtanaerobium respiraculi]